MSEDSTPDGWATARPILVFTALRVGLFLAVWLVIQTLSPLRGLVAVVVALVVSGIVSFFVLRGQRSDMGGSVSNVFRRINDRIDAASRAEDIPEDITEDEPYRQASGVDADRRAGANQSGHQNPTRGSTEDGANGGDDHGHAGQPQESPGPGEESDNGNAEIRDRNKQ